MTNKFSCKYETFKVSGTFESSGTLEVNAINESDARMKCDKQLETKFGSNMSPQYKNSPRGRYRFGYIQPK